jgi:tripartite-type tricarboxylate transporter receptor subunit TctC
MPFPSGSWKYSDEMMGQSTLIRMLGEIDMNRALLFTVYLALTVSPSEFAAAQTGSYPTKPIRWIVPFAPGGSVDTLARLAGTEISKNLGQQVIIDNRTGASGNIGTEVVARAAPDGYTIGSNTVPFVANTFLYKKVPYDVLSDFAPVSLMAATGNVMTVHPSLPVRSVRDLLQLAKSKPGALDYGTAGIGTNPHIAGELFNYLGKVNLVAVHYKGGYPALVATIAGEVPITVTSILESAAHITAGKLRAVGVTKLKRSPALPEVPTIAEAGLPGYEFAAWHILVAPKGTPTGVVSLLSENVKRILFAPGAPKHYEDRGLDVIASSPEEAANHLKNEMSKWGKVIKERGMRAD